MIQKRPWKSPEVRSTPVCAPQVLLVCTPQFDCSPIVGFACCKPNANACNGCKP